MTCAEQFLTVMIAVLCGACSAGSQAAATQQATIRPLTRRTRRT